MQLAQKMFNCPNCGPIEICFVHGDWVQEAYKNMVFEMTRPSFETFTAQIAGRSPLKLDGVIQPRVLADIEYFAEEIRKFQCSVCGKVFVIPKRIQDEAAVSAGPASLGTLSGSAQHVPQGMAVSPSPNSGQLQNPSFPPIYSSHVAIQALFDKNFTEAELDIILIDIGYDPTQYPTKVDKIIEIVDCLY